MLTTDIIKQHLVLDHDEDDQLIQVYWDAAVEFCEGLISGPIPQTERVAYFESLADPLDLGLRVSSISSIAYVDEAGDTQTLSPTLYGLRYSNGGWSVYQTDPWPVSFGTVTVTYNSGFQNVPAVVEQAILMTIGHLYQNRESTTPIRLEEAPLAVKSLLMPHARVFA